MEDWKIHPDLEDVEQAHLETPKNNDAAQLEPHPTLEDDKAARKLKRQYEDQKITIKLTSVIKMTVI